ncbi:MAG: hypothetical protein H7288_19020 [Kineosporiaceae bacterium]|nr:hypothetical protein [Aeromicrobium sp.]
MSENPWYQQLRDAWKPQSVRLLLIGESAPDDGGDVHQRRFFYAEPLSHSDNLFRSVVAALYDSGKLTKGDSKAPWLERLREDGIYLIDLSSNPVNALPPRERRAVLRESVVGCVENAKRLAPQGIIVCHSPTFQLLAGPLREAGLPLLHDNPIPFPLGNKRREFITKVRFALDGSREDQTPRGS